MLVEILQRIVGTFRGLKGRAATFQALLQALREQIRSQDASRNAQSHGRGPSPQMSLQRRQEGGEDSSHNENKLMNKL